MSEQADTPQGTHKATGWPEPTALAFKAAEQGEHQTRGILGEQPVKPPMPIGRDAEGRFVKGNPGGPGCPLGGRVTQFRFALLQAISKADVRNIAQAMIDKAVSGDPVAAKLVLSYAIGKPVETFEVRDASERFNTRVIFEHVDSATRARSGVEIVGGPPMND